MTEKIVVANWKMNPKSSKEAGELFSAIKEISKEFRGGEIAVCAPFLWLKDFAAGIGSKKAFSLGAQNCHWEAQGAFTGEISAAMLADLGLKYVVLGHFERRQFLGENNSIINAKIKAVLKAKLKPILCVGESQGEEMHLAVEDQLQLCLEGISAGQLKEIAIAYEPVWAIGTGSACSPDNALSANLFIKKILTKFYSRAGAEKSKIIYGGSVNRQNAAEYLTRSQMAGLLVGGASLNAEEFRGIIQALNNI